MLDLLPRPAPQAVTVIIPTFQRSAPLRNALETLTTRLKTQHAVEILVVDNNPLPQEKAFVAEFATRASLPIRYVHEPNTGLSNARNAGLAAVQTRFAAFLDDDMEATADWIDAMIRTSLSHGTAVVFGPVHARFSVKSHALSPHIGLLYSRYGSTDIDGEIAKPFGTGGCLIDRKACDLSTIIFDPANNDSGGEDDAFFAELQQQGVRFGWSPTALCYEIVPDSRVTSEYIFRRNFGFGQAPSRSAIARGGAGTLNLARHMSVGAAQLGVYGTVFILLKALHRPAKAKYLGLSARGLGKIFWGDRFRPKLYGPL